MPTDDQTPPDPSPLTGPDLIKARAKAMPACPGVYRMLDHKGEVLYVGKAKVLPRRVISYTRLAGLSNRIARMVTETREMEYTTTRTEAEALLLEANLIKRYRPRFNVLMRDDKSFPYILIRREHAAPQLTKHRGSRKTKGEYFGPFASAYAVNQTMEILQKAFLLRTCSDAVYDGRTRPCMLHQIKRCSAPCVNLISEADYEDLVQQAVAFLKGRNHDLRDRLGEEMQAASEAEDFETAAQLRDRIRALASVQSRQSIQIANLEDCDVFALSQDGGHSAVQVVFLRAGQNWGDKAYFPRHEKDERPEVILDSFLAQFYADRPAPKQILLSHTVPSVALLKEALHERSGHAVGIDTPKRGDKRRLIDHAARNALEALRRRLTETQAHSKLLAEVAEVFGMAAPPERIEIYDNSHIQGTHAIGAMVVAGPEGFDKRQYRTFNIRRDGLTPGDDFAMMHQVLQRRFKRAQAKDQAGMGTLPDLLLIDGGAGQVSATQTVLDEFGLGHITLVGIAKGPDRNAGREEFYRPGQPPFSLPHNSPALYLLQRLRDEAHRFAIGTHRNRRSRAIKDSPLDTIPGIGRARKTALLKAFGSGRAVAGATAEDLARTPGISAELAERIYEHFRLDHGR